MRWPRIRRACKPACKRIHTHVQRRVGSPHLLQAAQDDVGGGQVHASCQGGGGHEHVDGASAECILNGSALVGHQACVVIRHACAQQVMSACGRQHVDGAPAEGIQYGCSLMGHQPCVLACQPCTCVGPGSGRPVQVQRPCNTSAVLCGHRQRCSIVAPLCSFPSYHATEGRINKAPAAGGAEHLRE